MWQRWPSLRGRRRRGRGFRPSFIVIFSLSIVFQDYIVAEVAITEGEEEKRKRFQDSLQSDLLTVHCVS